MFTTIPVHKKVEWANLQMKISICVQFEDNLKQLFNHIKKHHGIIVNAKSNTTSMVKNAVQICCSFCME